MAPWQNHAWATGSRQRPAVRLNHQDQSGFRSASVALTGSEAVVCVACSLGLVGGMKMFCMARGSGGRMPGVRLARTPVEPGMPLPRRGRGRYPMTQHPARRATETTDDNQSCKRMLLHRSADGLSALAIEALGLWHITPSLPHGCLATPVDVTSETGGLARLLHGAASSLPRRHRNRVQSLGPAFGCHTFRS